MALYAFDGTWNADHGDVMKDNTNVVRFLEYFGDDNAAVTIGSQNENEDYIAGVGTRLGPLGRIVGGFNGAGGKARVNEFLLRFQQHYLMGDTEVEVIGFSRGSALALHFCNVLAAGVDIAGVKVVPEIRFLGLWETVTAFGLPGVFVDAFQTINLGWKLDIPSNVKNCYHALALDENRQAFQIHRPKKLGANTVLEERWFRGVHSDVGGGNGKVGLSSISLHWMLESAAACGLPIDTTMLPGLTKQFDAEEPIYHNGFSGEHEHRKVQPGDPIDASAATPLAPGASVTVLVDSRQKFNVTKVLLTPGARYTIVPDAAGIWMDSTLKSTAAGWPNQPPVDKPGPWDNLFWKVTHSFVAPHLRRVGAADWFELVACVDYDLKTAVPVGKSQHATVATPWSPTDQGRLSLFANDADSRYDNNLGSIRVTVTRVV